MNDVVFVMVNSKLANKKQVRKANEFDYNIDDLASDDEWIVEDEDGDVNVDLDILNEENTVEVGQGSGCGGGGGNTPQDDLEIPTLDDIDDEFEGIITRETVVEEGGVPTNDVVEGGAPRGDEPMEDDAYDPSSLNDLL